MPNPSLKRIDDLAIGESARVAGYLEVNEYTERLLRMGLIPGTRVTLKRRAPLGDPVEIRFRGYSLVLRPAEATDLQLESL
jgi:ferrous iron transport protein A